MTMPQMNAKVPDWYIHLKLLTMQNPVNHPMMIDKFIDSIFYPTRFLGIHTRSAVKWRVIQWKAFSWFLLLAICANTYFCLYGFKVVFPAAYTDSSLRLSIERFHFFINTFSAGFCIFYGLLSVDDINSVFDHIGRVDVVLMGLGLRLQFSYARSIFRFVLRIAVISAFTYLYSTYILFEDTTSFNAFKISNIVGITTSCCVVGAMEYQHDEFMRSVGLRFNTIKDRVVEIGPDSLSPSLKEIAELEALVKAYNQLNETCIIINDLFGKQILFVIGTIFATVTSCANDIVHDVIWLITQHTIQSRGLYLLNCYLGLSRLVELWFIIASCDSVVERAKEFTSELYQLMIADNSLRLSKNKKLYLHISSQTEPTFTAYGFFTLDNSLFHSVIAAATTYIVILIQFSQNSNSIAEAVGTSFVSVGLNFTASSPSTISNSNLPTKPFSFTPTN